MPFDGSQNKEVQMLDLLESFFDNGRHWMRRGWHNRDGDRCLVSAMASMRQKHRIKGDRTARYLQKAIDELYPQWGIAGLVGFNDSVTGYHQIQDAIDRARELALGGK